MTDTVASDVESLFPIDESNAPDPVPVETAPAAEAQPEPEMNTEAQPLTFTPDQPQEAVVDDKGHSVPLATFLEEKMTARELKKEVERLRQEQEASRQAALQPVKVPDPYEDPDGYNRYVQDSVQQNAWSMRAEMSGRFAEQKFGRETVEAALSWAQQEGQRDPTLGQRVQMQASPVEWVVEQYNRDQLLQRIQSDPTLSAQLMSGAVSPQATVPGVVAPQPAAALQPVAVTPKAAPPRSLATARSNAGHQTIPNGAVLDSVKFNLD